VDRIIRYLSTLFLILLLPFQVVIASTGNCVNFEIQKSSHLEKAVPLLQSICFTAPWDFYSLNCKAGKCVGGKLKKSKILLNKPKVDTQLGSPGFSLCRHLGGMPQFIVIKNSQLGTHNTSGCFFNEKDFLSIDNLIKAISSN